MELRHVDQGDDVTDDVTVPSILLRLSPCRSKPSAVPRVSRVGKSRPRLMS